MSDWAKKGFYIFLLGLATYGWWRIVGAVKRKINETEGVEDGWSSGVKSAGRRY